ncbi:MAG: MCE family protein, partial [Nocardioides sp.]|nr:MCE family protein [Nocardioides sp.]
MTRSAPPGPAPRAPKKRSAAAVAWGKQKGKVLGVVFLALILLAGWFTYMQFTDKFAKFDMVTLKADRVGLQLPDKADVKVRGLIVGEVLGMKATANGAVLKLGIDPDKINGINPKVTGAILPKTLFGEKYVSLIPPDTSFSHGLKPGATIQKTQIATELQSVIRDLYP